MYGSEDASPRGGVSAHFATPTGHRTVTLREITPDAALKEAEALKEEGYVLTRIHERGMPSSVLWTPENGWIENAEDALKRAVR